VHRVPLQQVMAMLVAERNGRKEGPSCAPDKASTERRTVSSLRLGIRKVREVRKVRKVKEHFTRSPFEPSCTCIYSTGLHMGRRCPEFEATTEGARVGAESPHKHLSSIVPCLYVQHGAPQGQALP